MPYPPQCGLLRYDSSAPRGGLSAGGGWSGSGPRTGCAAAAGTVVTRVCLLVAGAGRAVPFEAEPLTLLARTLSMASRVPPDPRRRPGKLYWLLGNGRLGVVAADLRGLRPVAERPVSADLPRDDWRAARRRYAAAT